MNLRPVLIFSVLFPAICHAKIPPADFVRLMEMHRARLVTLALGVSTAYSDDFGALSPDLIQSYLRLHDQPKVQSLQDLKTYGYSQDHSIAEELAAVYGSNIKQMSLRERKSLQVTIDSLNSIEKMQKQNLFDQRRLTSEQRFQLEHLERIVDVTDTGIARAEEMGVVRHPYDGSLYLTSHDQDRRGAEISRWIEDHYSQILNVTAPGFRTVLR